VRTEIKKWLLKQTAFDCKDINEVEKENARLAREKAELKSALEEQEEEHEQEMKKVKAKHAKALAAERQRVPEERKELSAS
jgi:hypothetical protein